jgi:hypothetical protein
MNKIILKNLKILDHLATYKEPNTWYERIGDRAIINYGKKCFPDGYYRINHIRIVIAEYDPITGLPPIGFEWTAPKSRIFPIESWMLTPGYSRVMRINDLPFVSSEAASTEARKHTDLRYDYLQLLGIYLNWKWLQFGEKYEVCSSGAVEVTENLTGLRLFPNIPQWRTPPCACVNFKDQWTWMNQPELMSYAHRMLMAGVVPYPELERR